LLPYKQCVILKLSDAELLNKTVTGYLLLKVGPTPGWVLSELNIVTIYSAARNTSTKSEDIKWKAVRHR